MTLRRLLCGFAIALGACSTLASAQTAPTGTIAGSVKDQSGAVLPGVTVEAASPALIEKVRTAVVDAQGVYRIVDLRPGSYSVTFTLPGFQTVKRENLDVTAGVTLNVNADMRVGSVEETITVSGAPPAVDVQNTNQHVAVTRDMLDNIPTGRHVSNFYATIPGVVSSIQDVGGTTVLRQLTNPAMSTHGSNPSDMPLFFDGMRYNSLFGTGGAGGSYVVNPAIIQEMAIDLAGGTAENMVSGLVSNVVPKQGGNIFSTYLFGNYANDSMQGNNIDDALKARGLAAATGISYVGEVNVGFGGPILKDKLWFYSGFRYTRIEDAPPGAYYATDPRSYVFVPDLSRRAVALAWSESAQLRVTWQAASAHQFNFFIDDNNRCGCMDGLSATRAYESTTIGDAKLNRLQQLGWRWTASSRVLIEGGFTNKPNILVYHPRPEVPLGTIGVNDTGTGISYRANYGVGITDDQQWHRNGKASLSYVTGSHSFKVGTQFRAGHIKLSSSETTTPYYYGFVNGVPRSITQQNFPYSTIDNMNIDLGIFAQDQWTLRRLTLNGGIRFDHLNMSIPEQVQAATMYTPTRTLPEIKDVPNWYDINPRFGAAYDLRGDGRTALKFSMGRYIEQQGAGYQGVVNPQQNALSANTTRSWTDSNNNFLVDCDLTNSAAQTVVGGDVCGAINNRNFGSTTLPISYDPDINGFGTRMFNWETSLGIQQELGRGLSVGASWNTRWYGNFRVQENVAVNASNFDPYCVTTPTDSRLPGGGGQQICGFYDIQPAYFGVSTAVVRPASEFGDMSVRYNGFDTSVNWRLPGNITLNGGTSTGRIATDYCDVVLGRPQLTNLLSVPALTLGQLSRTPAFCKSTPPMQTQFKMTGSYQLPVWGVQTSAAIQSVQYPQHGVGSLQGLTATNAFSTAAVMASLGRPLSGGTQTVALQIVPPGTLSIDPRVVQLDVRIAKNWQVGGARLSPALDVFNLLNSNAVLAVNQTFGARWLFPTNIIAARMFKVGMTVNF